MGLRFTGGATNDLIIENDLGISTYPFSMFCWFKAADITNAHHLMFLGDKDFGTDHSAIVVNGNVAGDPVRAVAHSHNQDGAGGVEGANSSIGYSADTWHSVLAVFVSDSERHVWLDGGNQGSNTNALAGSLAASDYDRFAIGALRDSTPAYATDAIIDWACVWNAELDDNDAEDLHDTTILPTDIETASVRGFWKFFGNNPELDLSGNGYHLTKEGVLAKASDPPLMPNVSTSVPVGDVNFLGSGAYKLFMRSGFGASSGMSVMSAGYQGPGSITSPPAPQARHAAGQLALMTPTTLTSGRVFSFVTPPERPGVWNYAVEPRDDKPLEGNPSPTRTAVSHDLISYWLHPDITDPNNDCMTLTYNDTTSVLNVVMRASRDFIMSSQCTSESVSVAEDVSISIA